MAGGDDELRVRVVNPDEIEKKTHAGCGWIYLAANSNFTGTTGQSPLGVYSGVVFQEETTITSATYDTGTTMFAENNSIITVKKPAGMYLPWPGLKQMAISGGSCFLIKETNRRQ